VGRLSGPAAIGERDANAALLLHNTLIPSPGDVIESVRELRRLSHVPVLTLNAALGYPPGLDRVHFRAIVLHYTMFYEGFAPLGPAFRELVERHRDRYLAVLFQDEQSHLEERIRFCAEAGVDCVFTCMAPPLGERAYGHAGVERVVTVLPGYVSERLRREGDRWGRDDDARTIDVGYRARKPPDDWSGAAREKYEIASGFARRAEGLGLALDISTEERDRIYGRAWPRFVGRCRAVLGTESGASITLPGTGEEIPYRTLSPRHLEAASLRTAQILFEGSYSGALEPMRHYIPLRKDFSNFAEVVDAFRDAPLRRELTARSRAELVDSGELSYRRLAEPLDEALADAGLREASPAEVEATRDAVYPPAARRWLLRGGAAARAGIRIALNRARGRPATSALRRRDGEAGRGAR
jgi:hypothetical protein